MDILEMNVDDLIPYENNPRKNDAAVEKVALSISAFGFKVPIVIDSNNVIVTGHTRAKAAKKLGLTTVPCIKADDLTDEQIKAFRLADNKVSEFSEWDDEKLLAELEALGDVDMSFDSSIYTVMCAPSCAKIAAMGDKHMRVHHRILWGNCTPMIISQKWRKCNK